MTVAISPHAVVFHRVQDRHLGQLTSLRRHRPVPDASLPVRAVDGAKEKHNADDIEHYSIAPADYDKRRHPKRVGLHK